MPQRLAAQDGSKSKHVYATLNIQEAHNIYGPGNAHKPPVHNVLEKPSSDYLIPIDSYGPVCLAQRVYSVPEEGHNVYSSLSAEPTYKVLEDPYIENAESLGRQGTISKEEPIYNNILKGPHSDGLNETSCDYEFPNKPV